MGQPRTIELSMDSIAVGEPRLEEDVMYITVIVLILLLLFGGGFGLHSGWHSSYPYEYGGGVSLLVLVIVLVVLFGPR